MKTRIFPMSSSTIHQTYDVIVAFYHETEPITSAELARRQISGLEGKSITANIGFLEACGVLWSPTTHHYELTKFGRHMGDALAKHDHDTLANLCAAIVTQNSPFLAELWRYIQQQFARRGDLSQEALKTEIVRRADQRERRPNARTGAKTIIDIMCDAGFLERKAAGRGRSNTTLRLGPAAKTKAQDIATLKPASDVPPDFSRYVQPAHARLLQERWQECALCMERGDTPLAASVMIAGLLEGLVYIKMKSYPDQGCIFNANAVPFDRKTKKKAASYENWTLEAYIEVAYELQWIATATHRSAKLVQDYRNVIHPFKQLSQQYDLTPEHAKLSWEITRNIARQLYP